MPETGTLTRSRVSRSTISTLPASASRAPTFSRIGTPFSSQCAYLSPGRSSRQSTRWRIPAVLSCAGYVAAEDRHHDHLGGRDPGWDDQARVVPVRHDQRADEPGADAP